MRSLPRLIISAVMSLAMAFAILVAPSAAAPEQNAAEASTCRIQYILCGRVQNSPFSSGYLTVTYNWGNKWSSTGTVRPGGSSPSSRDADGYYIPRGKKAWHESRYSGARISSVRHGPQWVKVNDLQNPRVRLVNR